MIRTERLSLSRKQKAGTSHFCIFPSLLQGTELGGERSDIETVLVSTLALNSAQPVQCCSAALNCVRELKYKPYTEDEEAAKSKENTSKHESQQGPKDQEKERKRQ